MEKPEFEAPGRRMFWKRDTVLYVCIGFLVTQWPYRIASDGMADSWDQVIGTLYGASVRGTWYTNHGLVKPVLGRTSLCINPDNEFLIGNLRSKGSAYLGMLSRLKPEV